jgi:hypothetical protein
MSVKVEVKGRYARVSHIHEIRSEAEVGDAVTAAIKKYQHSNPDESIFETVIRLDLA